MGTSLSQADGALLPIVFLAVEWLPIFRGADLLEGLPRLIAFWEAIGRDPLAARLIDETRAGLDQQMGRG